MDPTDQLLPGHHAAAGPASAAAADAGTRLGVPVTVGGPGLRPVTGSAFQGPALTVRHHDSVEAILLALDDAVQGCVLVVDDHGRRDRACVGDLVAHEARDAGVVGMIIWGSHRDTALLRDIGLPVVSLGSSPAGPVAAAVDPRPLSGACITDGGPTVADGDWVVADEDGVVVVPQPHGEVLVVASEIEAVERNQAERILQGTSLREQLDLDGYRVRRSADPTYSFREHLRSHGGAVES